MPAAAVRLLVDVATFVLEEFAEHARPLIDRTMFVENKPSTNGIIATEYAARAKPGFRAIAAMKLSASALAARKKISDLPAARIICIT